MMDKYKRRGPEFFHGALMCNRTRAFTEITKLNGEHVG